MAVPFTPDNCGGACGVGASGTVDCCFWARTTGFNIVLELMSAASAIAVKPNFTGILQWSVVRKNDPRSLLNALLSLVSCHRQPASGN
jgi:hypothetical protein